MAGAVSLTTNPLLLALVALAVVSVVLVKRTDAPWARSVGAYLTLAALVVAIRLVFQVLIGGGSGATVVLRLPELPLPAWAAGIRLGGAVTAEGLAYAAYDAMRLGVLLLCLGAANALANPRRALRSMPAALHEISVAVVIALSVAPQLVESAQRVRRARRLRGGTTRGWSAIGSIVLPVLSDAIERSLALAAGMESRGFGRTVGRVGVTAGSTALLVGGSLAAALGSFGVLGVPDAVGWAAPLALAGVAAVAIGLRRAGNRLAVTHYLPDRWGARETGLLAAGLATLAAAAVAAIGLSASLAASLHPSTSPLAWPTVHPLLFVLPLGAVAPLALAPTPRRSLGAPVAGPSPGTTATATAPKVVRAA